VSWAMQLKGAFAIVATVKYRLADLLDEAVAYHRL